MGLCECGCGGFTRIAPQTDTRKGHVKGRPYRFVSGHKVRGSMKARYCLRAHDTRVVGRSSTGGCRECARAAARTRDSRVRRWREYGITFTLEAYDALLEKQGGVCAVCAQAPAGKRRLSVDHDHATGRIRGLLCVTCNLLVEQTALFAAAQAYVQQGA